MVKDGGGVRAPHRHGTGTTAAVSGMQPDHRFIYNWKKKPRMWRLPGQVSRELEMFVLLFSFLNFICVQGDCGPVLFFFCFFSLHRLGCGKVRYFPKILASRISSSDSNPGVNPPRDGAAGSSFRGGGGLQETPPAWQFREWVGDWDWDYWTTEPQFDVVRQALVKLHQMPSTGQFSKWFW